MRFVGVIPARFASSRLPGKPLLQIAGRPLIEWVYRQALKAEVLERVLVATDDQRIAETVRQFGGEAMMTGEHASGTDRVAEAARRIESDAYVNIQGDEPLIAPSTVERVARALQESGQGQPAWQISTACVEIEEQREIESPHVVKVVRDRAGRALYFSRAPIPHRGEKKAPVYKHLGVYGYRREMLLGLHRYAPAPLERSECLEQLRWLENGIPIRVVKVEHDSLGVDTLEDLERVRPLLENAPQDARPPQDTRPTHRNKSLEIGAWDLGLGTRDTALELRAQQGKGPR